MIGRPKVPLVLTTPEQQALDSLAHRARTAPQVARRARIVLACARGLDNQTVAKKLRVSPQMVGRWRARFVTRRVDGLLDEPRPGAPRTITDDTVEAVIVRTLETTPDGATHWSTRTLAKATGLSHGTIARIWRACGLQPHRTKTFTLSPDPLLVEKVRDVVGLYLHPPDHALVLCVDEKSQIQALDRTQPLLPMQPGQTARHTHTYRRHEAMSGTGRPTGGRTVIRTTRTSRVAFPSIHVVGRSSRATIPTLPSSAFRAGSSRAGLICARRTTACATVPQPAVRRWLTREPLISVSVASCGSTRPRLTSRHRSIGPRSNIPPVSSRLCFPKHGESHLLTEWFTVIVDERGNHDRRSRGSP